MQEMKETVSSLDGVLIKPGRRVGNTTRISDNAIQLLFSGKIVNVKDHCDSEIAIEYLAKHILDRLSYFHNLYDKEKIEIELVKFGGVTKSITLDLLVVDKNGNYIVK